MPERGDIRELIDTQILTIHIAQANPEKKRHHILHLYKLYDISGIIQKKRRRGAHKKNVPKWKVPYKSNRPAHAILNHFLEQIEMIINSKSKVHTPKTVNWITPT